MNAKLEKLLRALAQSRHNRRKSPYFIAEGLRCAVEAAARRPEWLTAAVVSAGAAPETRAAFAAAVAPAGIAIEELSAESFNAVAETEGTQGVLCVLRKPEQPPEPRLSSPCTIILDQVREPGNFGTILRTAWALGIQQVWTTAGSADPWSPKVVRSGMGAQFAIELKQFPSLAAAAETFRALGGGEVWCAVMNGEVSLFEAGFTPVKGAIVMGNEANGISDLSVGRGVSIPMPGGAESLNVAQAATLLLYEALRRKSTTY